MTMAFKMTMEGTILIVKPCPIVRPSSLRGVQRGFSMIEALIAFAVLSFGIMGVVTLITSAKANQFETMQRTRAVTYANSLLERIRINPTAVNEYHTTLDTPVEVGADKVADARPNPNCSSAAACTPAELAAHDMWEWREELRGATEQITATNEVTGGLLEPQACVVFTAAAGRANTGQLSILVSWRGLVETSDPVDPDEECGDVDEALKDFRRQVAVRTYLIDGGEL